MKLDIEVKNMVNLDGEQVVRIYAIDLDEVARHNEKLKNHTLHNYQSKNAAEPTVPVDRPNAVYWGLMFACEGKTLDEALVVFNRQINKHIKDHLARE